MIPNLIAIVGQAGAGKSTLAEILVREHHYTRIRFAEPWKRMLSVLGLTYAELDGEFKTEPSPILQGRTPRYAMQTLGTEWGRNLIGENFWVDIWKSFASLDIERGRRVVCDDCRFLNEAVAVKSLHGQIWRINRPGLEASMNHQSETEMARIAFDRRFTNDGTIAALRNVVKVVLA